MASPAPCWTSTFPFRKERSGEGLTNLPALKDSANYPFPTPAQTCSEGEEAGLVFVLPQKRHDPLPHPLIPLVDELVAEVAVDLLGRHLLVRREGGVDEAGQLQRQDRAALSAPGAQPGAAGRLLFLNGPCRGLYIMSGFFVNSKKRSERSVVIPVLQMKKARVQRSRDMCKVTQLVRRQREDVRLLCLCLVDPPLPDAEGLADRTALGSFTVLPSAPSPACKEFGSAGRYRGAAEIPGVAETLPGTGPG